MADLIDRQAAIKLLRGECVAKYPSSFSSGLCAAANELSKLPTIDPESLRLKAEWKLNEDGKWACTYCESLAIEHPTDSDWQVITAFCPNCGADMRGNNNGC